ncbi:MAG: CorA family divalent cation transporter [Bacillus sp. (in: firmicutes)]
MSIVEAKEKDKNLVQTRLQFTFPFSLRKGNNLSLIKLLFQAGYTFFLLKDTDQESSYYGGARISHRQLERFFLPNIEKILFPASFEDSFGLRRMSKAVHINGTFSAEYIETDFVISSVDVVICPYQIGLINIRVDLPSGTTLTESLEFASEFRIMEPIGEKESAREIIHEGSSYKKMMDFIFHAVCPQVRDYMKDEKETSPYFGSLPFFMDERMFMIGFFHSDTEEGIKKDELFRIGHVYGYDHQGDPLVGASDEEYINDYYKRNVYSRWGAETYYVVSDYTFSCITKCKQDGFSSELLNSMYGIHYYSILYYYYYKIVLMKLSYEQSSLDLDNRPEKIEKLIMKISDFSAKYYFHEVNSTTSGKEIYEMVKQIFHIEQNYNHVARTLNDMFKNYNNIILQRRNFLLQILTLYTVVAGIYGMNLAIPDWEHQLGWSYIADYNLLEWIALLVAVSGIGIGIVLGYSSFAGWIRGWRNKRKDE